MSKHPDVIVAGAGPVGLFVACELALAGVSVRVLERDATPDSPWKADPLGMRGMNTLSVEAFYRRGLLDNVMLEERPMDLEKKSGFEFAGHFAGMMLDANKVERSRWKYRLAGPSLLPGPTSLERVDGVLTARAKELGVDIVRGKPVTGLAQEDNAVTVQAGGETYHAQWLVGCDGGRSVIRKAGGFEFAGTEPECTGYVGLCDLEGAEKLSPGFTITPSGLYIVGRPGVYYALDFDGAMFDRKRSITAAHFQDVLRRVSGIDVTVTKLHAASSFTDRCKQATTYLKGRVLLAGDSAHIHSPLGAQGLNTGINDAMNLGWKLAACVKGTAPPELLDTYTQERHPKGAWTLEWTRAQIATLRPNPFGYAVKNLVRDLANTVDGTNYLVDRIWGLSQRYDLGDAHPLVGSSAPDIAFEDGTRLGEKLRNGRGLLVNFSASENMAALARGWAGRVDYVNARPKDALGLRSFIVRPDGVVAWMTEETPCVDEARAVLRRWFGTAPT